MAPGGKVRRPYPSGREASRSSGASTEQVRNGHQSQNRQDTRSRRSSIFAAARRRGDRVMKRREFISLLGGAAAAWPLAARAQQTTRLPLVAILRSEVAGDSEGLRNSAALVQGLQALGWTEGRNVRIEKRWTGGSVDAMKALARELVALEPNVIVVISTPVTAAVMQETHT